VAKKKKKKKRSTKKSNSKKRPIAHELAKKQREISVAEFFEKNRHLLGFDNPKKALLTTVKEAVDNSLDACEDADILPKIDVQIIDMSKKAEVKKEIDEKQETLVTEEVKEEPRYEDRYRVIVEDNGPGIVKKQIPHIFARLLYGSKFHTLKQSRGQQGIGISAAALYGQLTTGKPVKIISKISPKSSAHLYKLKIDTQKNKPEIIKEKKVEWNKDHGTKIELDLEGTYRSGRRSIDKYLKQTAIANPHVTLTYTNPDAKQEIFSRAVEELPKEPKEIKPHPHGVELGRLVKMLKTTKARTIKSFLKKDFSRVGEGTAKKICKNADLNLTTKPKKMTRRMTERLEKGIKKTDIMNPPTDCISPIGAEELEKGLKKEIKAEFYTAVSRSPAVYRGNPFIVEVGIAYGGEQDEEGKARLLRYANRVPLLYQPGAGAIKEAAVKTNWRSYGLSQSSGSLPKGPCTIVVHIASVWVPFTSESKEAIAHYPEIIKEIKLALQECGRKLSSFVKKKKRIAKEEKKRDYIQTYIPHIGEALKDLLKLKVKEEKKVEKLLKTILEKKRGKLKKVKIDTSEYDENLALDDKDGKKEKKKK